MEASDRTTFIYPTATRRHSESQERALEEGAAAQERGTMENGRHRRLKARATTNLSTTTTRTTMIKAYRTLRSCYGVSFYLPMYLVFLL